MSAKAKRPIIVRMPSVKKQRAIAEGYALAVGKVAHIWNLLQEDLGRIFALVLNASDERAAFAVWYSTDSDRAQQRMLRDVVSLGLSRWPRHATARDDLIWLLKEVSALADHRNNAIHAPAVMMIGGGEAGSTAMRTVPAFGHPRANRLVGKDLLEEFDWYERWGETLTTFARQIWNAMAADNNPWPKRPQRPVRGRVRSHSRTQT